MNLGLFSTAVDSQLRIILQNSSTLEASKNRSKFFAFHAQNLLQYYYIECTIDGEEHKIILFAFHQPHPLRTDLPRFNWNSILNGNDFIF